MGSESLRKGDAIVTGKNIQSMIFTVRGIQMMLGVCRT